MYRTRIIQLVSLLLTISLAGASHADYKKVVSEDLWGGLYKDGGNTFYCGKTFSKKTPLLAVSHIYSDSAVRDFLQCGTKRQCQREDDKYQKIMSDLHNMVVADSYFEFKRKRAKFGELDASIEANSCDVRIKIGIIEPPTRIKGDIARVLFYLYETYGLPLQAHLSVLQQWHQDDPPSSEEKQRNAQIQAIQGSQNSFVANPTLAYNID